MLIREEGSFKRKLFPSLTHKHVIAQLSEIMSVEPAVCTLV